MNFPVEIVDLIHERGQQFPGLGERYEDVVG
jgi:hypothetical protein